MLRAVRLVEKGEARQWRPGPGDRSRHRTSDEHHVGPHMDCVEDGTELHDDDFERGREKGKGARGRRAELESNQTPGQF